MSHGDQTAHPKARSLRWILLAWPSFDQNLVGRKCTSRTGRGAPSGGRSYGVEESTLLIRNTRNNGPQESLRRGCGSATSVPTCCARNPIEDSEEDSPHRLENKAIE